MSRSSLASTALGQLPGFVAGAALFTACSRDLSGDVTFAPPLAAALSIALLSLLVYVAETRLGRRDGAVTAVVAGTSSLGVLWACLMALDEPVVRSTGYGAGVLPAPLVERGLTALAITAMAAPLPVVLLARVKAFNPAHALRIGARASLGLGALLVAMSSWPIAHHPSPAGYVATLPVYARLPAQTDFPRGHLRDEGSLCTDEMPVGPYSLRRICEGSCDTAEGTCALELGARPGDFVRDDEPRIMPVSRRSELVTRFDDARGLLVVEERGGRRIAFDLRTMLPRWVLVGELRGALGAPTGWLASALVGLVAAALALTSLRRRGAPQPLDATLRDDGVVVLDGRALTGVTVPPSLRPGPVVVFLARPLGVEHYRDGVSQHGARVEAGTVADRRDRHAARATLRDALAWAAVALTAAPLVAWAMRAM